ncbi:hypothetical protein CH263_20065 [Rhodococcus sp. 06-1059B-a]|nr:hypothetical protein [Rhodococcus sp. 06-1059B-a]OZD60790.1 hypothetical protein CH263_20065 [Rhodococcus sp. 06-1059B-a]
MNAATVLAQSPTPTPSGAGAEPPYSENFETVFSYIMWAGTVLGVLMIGVGGAMLVWQQRIGRSDKARTAETALLGGFGLAVLPAGVRFLIFDSGSDTPASAASSLTTETPTPVPTSVPTTAPVAVSPPAAPSEPTDWTPLIWILGVFGAVLVLALAVYLLVRTRHRILDRRTAHTALVDDFASAKAISAEVADAYADYLADPYAIFTRPLLDDLDQPRTAAFIDAFAAAGALNTDACPATADRVHAFTDAAHAAQTAWKAADTYARAIGMGVQTDDDKRTVRRIRNALGLALDDTAAAGERATAIATVQRLSDGLMTVPDRVYDRAKTAIETATRKQLTS